MIYEKIIKNYLDNYYPQNEDEQTAKKAYLKLGMQEQAVIAAYLITGDYRSSAELLGTSKSTAQRNYIKAVIKLKKIWNTLQ